MTVERTGREVEQVKHWLKEGPEQVRQSGWHFKHVLAGVLVSEVVEVKVPAGHVETHWPSEAKRLPVHVRQKSAEPAQVPQELEQAKVIRYYKRTLVNWKRNTYECSYDCLEG